MTEKQVQSIKTFPRKIRQAKLFNFRFQKIRENGR